MFVSLRHAVFLFLFLLSGCATTPPPVHGPKSIPIAQGENTATIILNRANTYQLGRQTAKVFFDGKVIGSIDNGQCVRLTVPSGQHNLHLDAGIWGGFGSMLGTAIAEALGGYNVKISSGQTLHYFAKPVYDSPNVGWLMQTELVESGREC